MQRYDAIVMGAGQAGMPLSTTLANAGFKTALVEREHLGGTCVNRGCTPTKTMVASARVAYLVGRADGYGLSAGEVEVDMARVRERKRAIVESFRGSAERRVRSAPGLDWLTGEARFTGPKTVEVSLPDGATQTLTAERIFINAGARPSKPPIPGLDSVKALDSTSIMELDVLPEHLLVIGGGYVGLEFGQMFRRYGSRVTVIQHGSRLLGREDGDVAEGVLKIMREDGLEILLNSDTLCASQLDGDIELRVRAGEGERTLTGSHLLVAAGRVPNTDRLNLAAAGVEIDKRGFIKVNDRLETSVPGVYALGDIKGGPAFTHISYDDFRIIRSNLLEGGMAASNGRMVPYTVFIDPQLGRIGLGEEEARDKGFNIQVAKIPMSYVARALEAGETRGFMKAIVEADGKQILGFAMLGLEGGEIASLVQVAMMGKLPYTALRDAVFSHPGLAEGLNTLFGTLAG